MAKQGDGELELQPHLLSFVQRGLAQRCLRVGGSISLERSVGEGSDPVLLRVVLRPRCGRVAGKRGMLERPSRMDHDYLLTAAACARKRKKRIAVRYFAIRTVHVKSSTCCMRDESRGRTQARTQTRHGNAYIVSTDRPRRLSPPAAPCRLSHSRTHVPRMYTSPADALMPLMQSCTITRGHPGVTRHAHDTTEPLCTSTALDTPSEVYPRSDAPPVHSSISHTLYGRHARPSVSQPSSPPMSAPPHS